jgi:hypothetical protein
MFAAHLLAVKWLQGKYFHNPKDLLFDTLKWYRPLWEYILGLAVGLFGGLSVGLLHLGSCGALVAGATLGALARFEELIWAGVVVGSGVLRPCSRFLTASMPPKSSGIAI